ncbi:DNA glycosylase [Annulohypoxylon maeteangense]|uniref:DNA glycosylase n=1 Tax=Annulohypoxylon maeteangense TaxID=1927788 RepID=UPI00200732FB|nr:DNA glycosylase [Annulohypoxylon maeteangense]KAI0885560.1 DNA glycosylase [Annulohypoxylon maeteangense]
MPPRPIVSPPRRITRSSLARFRFGDDGSNSSTKENSTPPPATDIEDVIPNTASIRKRKRTTTILETPSSLASSPRPATKIEKIEEEIETKKLPAPRRQRKPARKTLDAETGESKVTAPSDWEEIYDTVKAMRQPGGPASNAAVDTMGCERLALTSASPRDQRFQTLIALMLSSQTKDTTNAIAMKRLQTELPPHTPGAPIGLNLENILAVDPEHLNQLIWAVGFHNNKTKYIKAAAPILRDKWASDIPDTIEGLVALPGVGPKMAHLCLSAAWGRTEGIGVDVHVHRLTNMWGWHATKSPEETRLALQAWLPRDRWREINWLLVGFGQTVCLPVGKKCGDCELGLRGLCKAAERKKVAEGRRVRESVVVEKMEVKGEDGGAGVKVEVKEEEREEEIVERDVVVNENMEGVVKKEESTERFEDIGKVEVKSECSPESRQAPKRSRKSRNG